MVISDQNKLTVSPQLSVSLSEIEFSAIRSHGPGGQHVNKTNSAIELRFAIAASSLPEQVKSRLFAISDRRLNTHGVIVIKSGSHRSQLRNKEDALRRLADMIRKAAVKPKSRKATRPTKGSIKRRLEGKKQRSAKKSLRGRVKDYDD